MGTKRSIHCKNKMSQFTSTFRAEFRGRALIQEGNWCTGMTRPELEASIGYAKRVNVSAGKFGRHVQWIDYRDRYFYFEDGKLTSWSYSE